MSTWHDNVDYTFEAVMRLRGLIREHDASGEADTPFHKGIRETLADLDAAASQDEWSAA